MRGPGAFAMEYLVTMTTHVPDGTPGQAVDDIRTREAAHSRELAAQGHLLRLWRPPLQPSCGSAFKRHHRGMRTLPPGPTRDTAPR